VAAAALGFLVWNWSPARIFLGDVGSVPLGYVLGFLLNRLALGGQWQAALILPAYFLADASITLLRRLLRGERVWQAHREHFYQRAVQQGLGHDAVVLRVVAADIVLIACAWAAARGWGFVALGVAALTVLALLAELGRPGPDLRATRLPAAGPRPIPRPCFRGSSDSPGADLGQRQGGLAPFAAALAARGIALISTGGTAKTLADAGLAVTEVAAVTQSPEMLDAA